MTLLELIKAYVEEGASEEQIATGDYAQRQIDSLTNFKFLELMSEAIEAEETTSQGES